MNQRGSDKDVLGLEQAAHACFVSRTHAVHEGSKYLRINLKFNEFFLKHTLFHVYIFHKSSIRGM